jgi:hypothetical protein
MDQRRGRRIQGLIGVMTAGLLVTACAAGKNPAPRWSASGTVDERCGALIKDLSYARRSMAEPALVAVAVAPVGLTLGVIGGSVGLPQGFFLPVMAFNQSMGAVQTSRTQFASIRDACVAAGGPEHVEVAMAIERVALRHQNDRFPAEAVRLYRDGVALLERAGEEELEGATSFRLAAASVMGEYPATRDEAAAIYARTLAALEARRGPEHADLVDTLEPYARLLRTLGRGAEAEQLEARLLAIRRAPMAVEADGTAAAPCVDSTAHACAR